MSPVVRTTFVDRVHLSTWWGAPSVADVASIRAELQSAALADRRPLAMLLVVAPETAIAPSAPRQAAISMLRELGPRLVGCAVVIEGTGFRAAAVRAMFGTMALLVRGPLVWAAFDSYARGVAWLRQRIELDEPGLGKALQVLRAAPEQAAC